MVAIPHPELHNLRDQLCEIYNAMATLGSVQLAARPPILDSSIDLSRDGSDEFHSHQDAVHGLRALREAVKRDLDVLEKVSSRQSVRSDVCSPSRAQRYQ